jgi:hypothetical protein
MPEPQSQRPPHCSEILWQKQTEKSNFIENSAGQAEALKTQPVPQI